MNANIPEIKTHGQSLLVVRLVVTVYNCVICAIIYMILAAQDLDIAIGAFNAPD